MFAAALSLTPVFQTFAAGCSKPMFLGLVPWYQYLTLAPDNTGVCSVTGFDSSSQILSAHSPILLIALAVLDDLIRVAALVAVGYVIYGGIQYVTSQGAPDATKRAQQTIINALIGVVVAILAVSIVTLIGKQLGK